MSLTKELVLLFQSELCSQSLVDIIQSVVNGSDGCLFCYGHARLGESLHIYSLCQGRYVFTIICL